MPRTDKATSRLVEWQKQRRDTALIEWQKQRRDLALSEVAFIEKQLIEAGEMEGPTTSDLRKMWRDGVLVRVE